MEVRVLLMAYESQLYLFKKKEDVSLWHGNPKHKNKLSSGWESGWTVVVATCSLAGYQDFFSSSFLSSIPISHIRVTCKCRKPLLMKAKSPIQFRTGWWGFESSHGHTQPRIRLFFFLFALRIFPGRDIIQIIHPVWWLFTREQGFSANIPSEGRQWSNFAWEPAFRNWNSCWGSESPQCHCGLMGHAKSPMQHRPSGPSESGNVRCGSSSPGGIHEWRRRVFFFGGFHAWDRLRILQEGAGGFILSMSSVTVHILRVNCHNYNYRRFVHSPCRRWSISQIDSRCWSVDIYTFCGQVNPIWRRREVGVRQNPEEVLFSIFFLDM